jgi:ribosomal protein L31E
MPILLVFEVYLYITKDSLSLPFITKQAKVIYKAIKKVRRFYAKQQINNTLVIRNKLNTKLILILLL